MSTLINPNHQQIHSPTTAAGALPFNPRTELTESERLKLRISQLKFQRIKQQNTKLQEILEMERIHASNACLSIIEYCNTHEDKLIPSIWGTTTEDENPYTREAKIKAQHSEVCCIII